MYKIYHNPKCTKSREGLEFLKSKNVDFEVIEYLKNPLTESELKNLLMLLNLKPLDIVRTQEELYKTEYKNLKLSDAEWIKIMVQNPKLIQRPIVVKNHKAVVARPAENIDLL